ncbi:MAG: Flp pilus assembly protein CpaB [Pseudomonadota bacterium]|nr:Flp pilus assembly protein CpaB [Pseudomonadota bacterium]
MPKRKLLLLAVAGLVAIVTVVIARSVMQPAADGTIAPVVQSTEVIAASRDLPTGTIIKEMDLKWIPWAADAETSKLYVKGKAEMSSVVGAVLREGLRADEPLLAGRVVQPHEQGFLAAVLTPGMRAVSVTLTPSGEVAGFIFPGDHVDVILTHRFVIKNEKGENESTERALSETVITDARVLALDQKSDSQSTDPKVAQLATLEVSPRQAEKLALAVDMAGQNNAAHGAISLVLRSLATTEGQPAGEAESDKSRGPTMDSDISPVYPRVIHLQTIHVMRGKEMTETIFQSPNASGK